jgi:hypothetical protein
MFDWLIAGEPTVTHARSGLRASARRFVGFPGPDGRGRTPREWSLRRNHAAGENEVRTPWRPIRPLIGARRPGRGECSSAPSSTWFSSARIHGLLGPAVVPRPNLAPAGRQLLLLRELEPVAGPDRRGVGHPGLRPRPADGPGRAAARAPALPRGQRGRQPRAALLLQVCQLLPPVPGRGGPGLRRARRPPNSQGDAPDRHLVLHVRGDQLHPRRLPPGATFASTAARRFDRVHHHRPSPPSGTGKRCVCW